MLLVLPATAGRTVTSVEAKSVITTEAASVTEITATPAVATVRPAIATAIIMTSSAHAFKFPICQLDYCNRTDRHAGLLFNHFSNLSFLALRLQRFVPECCIGIE
jgi:hypothetical protein